MIINILLIPLLICKKKEIKILYINYILEVSFINLLHYLIIFLIFSNVKK